jgi:NHL repeat
MTRVRSQFLQSVARPRARSRIGVIASSVVAVGLLVLAPSAFAGKGVSDFIGVKGVVGSAPGQFNNQVGVAVNDPDPGGPNDGESVDPYGNSTDGYVYVADEDNHRIQVFDAAGEFVFVFGGEVNATASANVCPRPGFPGDDCAKVGNDVNAAAGYLDDPQGIAIDQVDGSVYVSDQDNLRVQKFTAAGEFVYMLGGGVNQTAAAATICPRPGFPADVCKVGVSGSANGQFGSTFEGHPAVDPNTRDLWVPDAGGTANRRMQKFDKDGAFLLKFGANGTGVGLFGSGAPNHVAVDDASRIYVLDDGQDQIERFAADGTGGVVFAAGELSGAPEAGRIAIDHNGAGSADDRIFVVKPNGSANNSEVKELDEAGTLIDTHMQGSGIPVNNSAGGLAVNPADGRIYFSTDATGHKGIYVLDDLTGPLEASIDPVTDVEATTATLNATIDPNGSRTSFHLEISKDGVSYQSIPVPDADAGLGTTPQQVSFPATGLEANTFYRVRLVATRVDGDQVTTGDLTFLTDPAPPEVTTDGASQVTDTTAQLNGRINPGGLETTYWFEWGDDSYGNTTPVPAASAGSGGIVRTVGETIAGLAPESVYHYRLCARNAMTPADTPTCGADQAFTTGAAISAPQGRSYEMVTAPDKPLRQGHGGIGSLTRDFARANTALPSADGESVRWGLFPGVTSGEAGHGFTWAETYEIYDRTPTGWDAEAVTNIAPLAGAANAIIDRGGMSADLKTSAWYTQVPLFAGGSQQGLRVMGDTGGPRGAGWYPWTDPSWYSGGLGGGWGARIDDQGDRLVGWLSATVGDRGHSIVPADGGLAASNLNPPQQFGQALHLSGPEFGWRPGDLIGECTGTAGNSPTGIPMRDAEGTDAAVAQGTGNMTTSSLTITGVVTNTGTFEPGQRLIGVGIRPETSIVAVGPGTLTLSSNPASNGSGRALTGLSAAALADDSIGARDCEEGSPTDFRGSALSGSEHLGGSSVTSVSDDGHRVFFLSPDPDAGTDPDGSLGYRPAGNHPCAPTTGASTECPAQLYVRQYTDTGEPVVRWISRAEDALFDAPQEIGLLGHGASFEGASRDGSVVYFRTNAPLTVDDPNGGPLTGRPVVSGDASPNSWDLYRYSVGTDNDADPASGSPGGRLTRITGGPDGNADPNTNCFTRATSGPQSGNCWGDASSSDLNATNSVNGAGTAVRFMSDDGKRVYFVTAAQISGATNAPANGGVTSPTGIGDQINTTSRNLYLYDADKAGAAAYEFIARLPFSSSAGGSGDFDSCATFGAENNGPILQSEGGANDLAMVNGAGVNCVHGSSSGDAIVFQTSEQLTADDQDTAADIYAYRAASDQLTRISAPPPGAAPYVCQRRSPTLPVLERCNADMGVASWTGISNGGEKVGLAGLRHWNIAEHSDGSLKAVYFESRLPLTPDKVNGVGEVADTGGENFMDVYQWRDGEVSLVSTGDSPNSSFYSGNSRDGEHVFFWTEQRISPWEIDDRDGDLYNATTADPIPDPVPSPAVCGVLAGGCHAGDAGPVSPAPRTTSSAGDGNASVGARKTVSIAGLGAKARRHAARTGRLSLRVRTTGTGKLFVIVKGRIAKRNVVLARASKSVERPGLTTVEVRLDSTARRALLRGRRLSLSIRVRQAGARPRSMTVRLRRAGS